MQSLCVFPFNEPKDIYSSQNLLCMQSLGVWVGCIFKLTGISIVWGHQMHSSPSLDGNSLGLFFHALIPSVSDTRLFTIFVLAWC